jgi:outer membrane lipoprotein-sorting protein
VIAFLRRISTRQLLALCIAVVALGVGSAAIAIAASGGPTPPPKDLPVAIHDAVTAPQVDGVTARIDFTNRLVTGTDVRGGSPLLSGASGRLWASSDGHLRLELQADASSEGGGASDTQILSDGHQVTVYDSGTNTVYKAELPAQNTDGTGGAQQDQPPSVADIQNQLNQLMDHAIVSGAQPTDVAGQPAYNVRIEPKQNGGLVGGAELAWDAVHGTPLRAAVYSKGDSSPVIELSVTDISFGPVDSSVFDVGPPSGAKVTDLTPQGGGSAEGSGGSDQPPVTGVQQVQAAVSFPLAAPDSLAGMQRNEVRLIRSGDHPAALVTYGQGLGGIAVIEHAADSQSSQGGATGGPSIPTVSIDGVQGHELDTPLGSLIAFQRGGVGYTVVGSVVPGTAQAAARGL